jgi:hypothetical protein
MNAFEKPEPFGLEIRAHQEHPKTTWIELHPPCFCLGPFRAKFLTLSLLVTAYAHSLTLSDEPQEDFTKCLNRVGSQK